MISVIITTYEQTNSLIGLLYCLLAQDINEPFEVIVCDDGSSTSTLCAISDRKELSLLNIRYVWQPKPGYRAARSKNNGIRIATGDILLFLDADILIGPDYLRRHRIAHIRPQMIVCNPRQWVVDPQYSPLLEIVNHPMLQKQENIPPDWTINNIKHNVRSLIENLAVDCADVDRAWQREAAESHSPWMSCIGFSFSVDKCAGVYFDENFEGWGPEDRELALRLTINHNYTVAYNDDIEVYHIESYSTGRNSLSLLPDSHSAIVTYLRNMLYLDSKYPQCDLSAIMAPLMLYFYDANEQQWKLRRDLATPSADSPEKYRDKIALVQSWFYSHNS